MAAAKETGLLSATAPTGSFESSSKNSPTALVEEATTGVPEASDSRAAKQKVSIGPGAIERSALAITSANIFRSTMYPMNVTGRSLEIAFKFLNIGPIPT